MGLIGPPDATAIVQVKGKPKQEDDTTSHNIVTFTYLDEWLVLFTF